MGPLIKARGRAGNAGAWQHPPDGPDRRLWSPDRTPAAGATRRAVWMTRAPSYASWSGWPVVHLPLSTASTFMALAKPRGARPPPIRLSGGPSTPPSCSHPASSPAAPRRRPGVTPRSRALRALRPDSPWSGGGGWSCARRAAPHERLAAPDPPRPCGALYSLVPPLEPVGTGPGQRAHPATRAKSGDSQDGPFRAKGRGSWDPRRSPRENRASMHAGRSNARCAVIRPPSAGEDRRRAARPPPERPGFSRVA